MRKGSREVSVGVPPSRLQPGQQREGENQLPELGKLRLRRPWQSLLQQQGRDNGGAC